MDASRTASRGAHRTAPGILALAVLLGIFALVGTVDQAQAAPRAKDRKARATRHDAARHKVVRRKSLVKRRHHRHRHRPTGLDAAAPTVDGGAAGNPVGPASQTANGPEQRHGPTLPHPTPAEPAPPAAPAAPEPEPEAEPELDPPDVTPAPLFAGTKISDFAANQSAPGAITEVRSPTDESESALRMTVKNSDVYPLTPTENPRAQLLSPAIFSPGDEFWWHSKFFLPESFPDSVPGWLTVMEGPYGAPYAGTPPWHIEINGEGIRWQRNATYDWDIPWEMPLMKNQWVDVLLHCRFATDGWVEMWIDGEPITFFAGSVHNPNKVAPTRRLDMRTMDSSNDGGPNFAVIQSYRQVDTFESVTLDQGPMLIGETRASVES
jgi:hypothetical protein